MNYTVTDNNAFITIASDVGNTLIHKSAIRGLKAVGNWMVKIELEKPLMHVYLNFANVTNVPFDSNTFLRDTIAAMLLTTQ